MFEEIPTVSTATKYPKRITDSPSTTYLITEADIRSSGVTNIPDLLRMIPGINVMATSASEFNVSSRGGNQLLANKMLILIDGRYVYHDMYGMVFWEGLTVLPEDIKRIEIVKGPSSALYGANAFSGVINIITKNPEDDPGTTIMLSEGEPAVERRNLIHRGRTGEFSYKISAGYKVADKWEETDVTAKGFPEGPGSAEDVSKYSGLLQYHPNNLSTISVSGGRSSGTMEFFPIEYLTVLHIDNEMEWLRLKYTNGNLMIHYFENRDMLVFYEIPTTSVKNEAKEGELTYSFDAGDRNTLTLGASVRNNGVVFAPGMPNEYGRHKQDLWGIYIEDEFRYTDKISFFAGGRYDDKTLSDAQVSPRGSIVYHPVENDAVRLSVGKAYRNPSQIETYLVYIETLATGADLGLPLRDFDFEILGNNVLKPEEIITYNLGYQSNRKDYTVTVDIFYNEMANVVQHRYETGNVLDIENDINFSKRYQNVYSSSSYGTELLISRKFSSSLSGVLSYAYLREYRKDSNERIRTSPENKVAAEIRKKIGESVNFNIQGIYAGSTEWEFEGFNMDESGLLDTPPAVYLTSVPVRFKLPSYTMVNVNLGIMLGENIEISFAGFNILDHKHREFPEIDMPIYDSGTMDDFSVLANSRSNSIGRRWTASLRIDF